MALVSVLTVNVKAFVTFWSFQYLYVKVFDNPTISISTDSRKYSSNNNNNRKWLQETKSKILTNHEKHQHFHEYFSQRRCHLQSVNTFMVHVSTCIFWRKEEGEKEWRFRKYTCNNVLYNMTGTGTSKSCNKGVWFSVIVLPTFITHCLKHVIC